ELRLRLAEPPARALELGHGPGVLDREARLAGEGADEVDLARAEEAADEPVVEVEEPEDGVARVERDAEDRAELRGRRRARVADDHRALAAERLLHDHVRDAVLVALGIRAVHAARGLHGEPRGLALAEEEEAALGARDLDRDLEDPREERVDVLH